MRVETAYFCPACGSASIDFSTLDGGKASCRICKWDGQNNELLAHEFKTDLPGETAIQDMITDMRRLYSGTAERWAGFLLKWGFLTGSPQDVANVARYMARIALASVKALLEVREEIEKARVQKRG